MASYWRWSSQTSLIAHHIRDEIRLIAPGTYLGIVFWDRDRLINFALQFAAAPPA